MKFVILNGPPKSGKSTIGGQLSYALRAKYDVQIVRDSFAAPMKHYIAVALGQAYDLLAKDSPNAILAGYSPREFLISLSEDHMKPRYGKDIFGRLLLNRILRDPHAKPDFIIVDDGGFPAEIEALPEKDTVIIRILRDGTDYANDSREYLDNPDRLFYNDAGIVELMGECNHVADWLMSLSQT